MKICPNCQASVSDTAKFCVKCGFNIKKFEADNAANEHFCPDCGTKFSGGNFCPECGYDISRDLAGGPSGGMAAASMPAASPAFSVIGAGVDLGAMNEAAQSQLYEKEGFVVENGILTGYTGKKRIITIPGTVEEIFDEAFAGNQIISFVEIEEGVKVIGKRAFANCESLVKISIPASVEKLFDNTFEGTKLETLIVTACDRSTINSVLSQQARDYLSSGGSMDAYLEQQNGRVVINILALEQDAQKTAAEKERRRILASCKIQNGVLVKYTGSDCHVQIPDGVTTIGERAFEGCKSLTSITIPDGVTSIGDYAFRGCSSLTSITIPNSVTAIGDYAFDGCSSLTSVTIPNSVTTIGKDAFFSCSSLIGIWVDSDNSSYSSDERGVLYNKNKTILVAVPGAFSGKYTILDRVTTVGYSAFANCYSLTSVTIPNSVTTIGKDAFYYCSSLTSITIPNSVTTIGDGAFYYCSSLTSITIPNSVTAIGELAFAYCDSLTSITIPNSVTTISKDAFFWWGSNQTICIPARLRNQLKLITSAKIVTY